MRKNLSILIVPAIFLVSVMLFVPGRSRFQYDGDEGVFLMMGMLIDQGHDLFDPIWSDQPPLFPMLLASGFRLVGYRVGFGRLLVAGFSALLLGAAYQFLRERSGRIAGVSGVLLIVFSPYYLRLSVSVMGGLPAISLGLLALLLLILWHRHRGTHWLVFSGITLALSVGIKLLTGMLAPIMGLGLLITGIWGTDRGASWLARIRPALVWSLSFLAMLALLLFGLVGPEHIPDLLGIHLTANLEGVFSEAKYTFAYHIRNAYPLLAVAALGIVHAVRQRRWLLLYPAAWMLAFIVFLSSITPSWDHHVLFVTIPAALLAGYALAEAAAWIKARVGNATPGNAAPVEIAAAMLMIIALLAPSRPDALEHLALPWGAADTGLRLDSKKVRVLEGMIEYGPQTRWVLTDSQMMAFRARLPVPPETVVFSTKRITAGALTEEDLIHILEEYEPEQVYLDRFDLPALRAALQQDYVLKDVVEDDFAWYVREDLRRP